MNNRLVELFHSITPEANKELILESLSDTNGKCRVVFVIQCLGNGYRCQRTVHTQFSTMVLPTVEAYMQEIGQFGRDGTQSLALLYCHIDNNWLTLIPVRSSI